MRVPIGFEILRQTLTLRYYRLYVLGNITSNLGTWTQRVAMGWLTWQLTHSATWLGVNAICEAGPSIVIGMFAGAVIDRVDQFKMLRLAQLWSLIYSAAFAVLTLTGVIDIWMLTSLVLMRGVVIAFYRPTRSTVIYGLVGREFLPSALALNSMVFNTSRFLGPAIGGTIIAWAGTGWTFVCAFCLFCVMTIALREIKKAGLTLPPITDIRRSIWRETIDGIRYILHHEGIRLQLLLLIVTSVAAKPLPDLMPGFAGQVFDRGSSGLAILLSCEGIGALIGAVWMTSRASLTGLTRITLGNILLMSVTILLFSQTSNFWIAAPINSFIGFAFIVQSVSNQTLIQSAIEPGVRGRVMSIYGIIAQSVPSLGTLTMGAIAAHTGLRLPVAVGAICCALLWAWAWRLRIPLAAALETEPPALAAD
ncbi:MAG TPA: MFS transporter [Stellaceae bacterium]|jgi:predicted MFS family arabinose efflux permease